MQASQSNTFCNGKTTLSVEQIKWPFQHHVLHFTWQTLVSSWCESTAHITSYYCITSRNDYKPVNSPVLRFSWIRALISSTTWRSGDDSRLKSSLASTCFSVMVTFGCDLTLMLEVQPILRCKSPWKRQNVCLSINFIPMTSIKFILQNLWETCSKDSTVIT